MHSPILLHRMHSPALLNRLAFIAAPKMAGGIFRQHACPQQIARQASVVPSTAIGFDPGVATAATLLGCMLWLAVEGFETKPQGWLSEDVRRQLEVGINIIC
jgi:hypothetical protein